MASRALNSIIDDINTQILTVSFGSKITTRGLCYLQEKDGKTFPMENTDVKNAGKISWDDKYPLQVYHRIIGQVEKETDTTQGVGNKISTITTYQMRLVGIGSKGSLSAAGYEDNQEICKAIENILPAFITSSEYLEIVSSEVIKQEVYDSEWAGVQIKKLSLEGIAFWIDYTLKVTNCSSSSSNQASVRNSDSTYQDNVNCNQTLVLPDINITKNDDSVITYPASKDLDIGVIDPCVGSAPTNWGDLLALLGRGYNIPQSTGQVTSYRTGDDANIESTIFTAAVREANSLKAIDSLADFNTLNNNNVFGNTNRFTDSVGGQNYDGTGGSLVDYAIDHLTGLGWYIRNLVVDTWDNQIDAAVASSQNGFTDWFVPNINQACSIRDSQNGGSIGNSHGPFLFIQTDTWTSTTTSGSTTSAMYLDTLMRTHRQVKTTIDLSMICRKHY